jgi:two-component system NtrC family response regulator/two-component system response regulator AtoC
MEREHIERVLDSVDGHRGKAARILGISERNLYRKLKAYQI